MGKTAEFAWMVSILLWNLRLMGTQPTEAVKVPDPSVSWIVVAVVEFGVDELVVLLSGALATHPANRINHSTMSALFFILGYLILC